MANLAVIGAPAVGGLIAAKSYAPLFIADAVISVFSAVIVFFALPETRPQPHPDAKPETVRQSFSGYGRIFMDLPFMGFILVSMLLILVIMNFNTTLGVFLRDQHGVPEAGYGYMLSMNALMVVIMQFWLSRNLSKYKPMLMVAVGALLYGIGYGMYGVTSAYLMFAVAMFIITIAEMIVDPLFQSLVASFAPEDMRGRYMATYAISWQVAYGGGPYLAGLFLDKANPNMWWATCAALSVISMLGFMILDKVHHFPVVQVTTQPLVAD